MKLVDQFGQPLKRSDLKKEIAGATTTGVRQILQNQCITGLNPQLIASYMQQANQGDMDGYLSMAEEIEEKDCHFLSVMGTRKRAIAQLPITVEAASTDKVDEDNADVIKRWLDRDRLEDEMFDILDAIGKGFSATEIMWDLNADSWMPYDLIWRDPRWFEFDRVTGQELRLRENAGSVALSPYKFIVHKHKAKSGLAARGGVIRPCSWMFLFKNFSIKDWVIFAETYGMPMRIGTYHGGASDDEKDVLLRAVADIGSDAAAIIPETMKINFVEAMNKSATSDVFEKLINFCDAQMSKAVLGQTMTTDDGSSRSQAEVHNDVRGDIERSDAKQLAATLNDQLVKPIIILNKGIQKRYPRIRIGRSEDVDVDKVITAADKAVRFGMRVSEKGLREKVGFPEPENDDDILKIPSGSTEPPIDTAQQATAARQSKNHADPLGGFADELSDDYEDVMNPTIAALQQAADQTNSFDEFKQNLLELADDLEIEGLAQKLTDSNFMANIAGQVNAKLEEE